MIVTKPVGSVRFGYYLIKPVEFSSNDGFIMPDEADNRLALGKIIESGEVFYHASGRYDLDFNPGYIVVYRESGNISLKINDEEHVLVPHENVLMAEMT